MHEFQDDDSEPIYFEGPLRFGDYEHPVIRCCPGDWPRIKAVVDPEGVWSTVQLGTSLIAAGPATRTTAATP